jgi:hypothetical protein
MAAHPRNTSVYRRFWSRRRAEVVERDGCKCLMCRTSENLTAHHKIPWYISRDDSPCNLVTLCRRIMTKWSSWTRSRSISAGSTP